MMHPSILQRWPLFITFKIKNIELFPRNLRLDRVNKGNLVIKFEWGSCMSSMPILYICCHHTTLFYPLEKRASVEKELKQHLAKLKFSVVEAVPPDDGSVLLFFTGEKSR